MVHFYFRKNTLKSADEVGANQKGLNVVAIHGMGGSGKSEIAKALANDPEVLKRFSNGVLWTTLGEEPIILAKLLGWIQAFEDSNFRTTDLETALRHLQGILQGKSVLIVIDDVWEVSHITRLLAGGPQCAVLITTREESVLRAANVPLNNRYLLREMKEDEALKMLAGGGDKTLDQEVRPLALDVAKAVGFLPLALELAAAQVNTGIPWKELKEDLTCEIERLESLDDFAAQVEQDPEVRKKMSLVASLNLSLRKLSPIYFERLAWFGVLPDDITLQDVMAANLWSTDTREARNTLLYFSSKSLLVQNEPIIDEKPVYQIHDVLHHRARKILTDPAKPRAEGELPGLGLTLSQAHTQLINRYRLQTKEREWHTLSDDGYIYSNLAWHLLRAGQDNYKYDDLYSLINQDWMDAKLAHFGSHQSFAADVDLAIQAAEQETPPNIVQLIRNCLIYSTISSSAASIAPEALGVLAQCGQEEVDLALDYADLIMYAIPRSKAYLLVSQALLMQNKTEQRDSKIKEILLHSLDAVKNIQEQWYQSEMLLELVKIMVQLEDIEGLSQALTMVQDISDERNKVDTLTGVVEALTQVKAGEGLKQALEATKHIKDDRYEVIAIARVAEAFAHLKMQSEAKQAAIEALNKNQSIRSQENRAEELAEVASALFWADLQEEAKLVANDALLAMQAKQHTLNKITTLANVVWVLTQINDREGLGKALAVTDEIEEEYYRARVMIKLARVFVEANLQPEAKDKITKALSLSQAIQDERSKGHLLAEIAEVFAQMRDNNGLRQTLNVIQDMHEERHKVYGLETCVEALALVKDINGLKRAWLIAQAIEDNAYKAKALALIAKALAELGMQLEAKQVVNETLSKAQAIKDEEYRAHVLLEIAEVLIQGGFEVEAKLAADEALSAVQAMREEPEKPRTLVDVAGIMALVRNLEGFTLALKLAQKEIQNMREGWDKAYVLVDMAKALIHLGKKNEAKQVAIEAQAVTQAIEDNAYKAEALALVAKALAELGMQLEAKQAAIEVLSVVQATQDVGYQEIFALSLATEVLIQGGFEVEAKLAADEALSAVQAMREESEKPRALVDAVGIMALVRNLEGFILALNELKNVREEWDKAYVLVEMAKALIHLDQNDKAKLAAQILTIVQTFQDEGYKTKGLVGVAEVLAEFGMQLKAEQVLNEAKQAAVKALSAAQTIQDDGYQKTCALALAAEALALLEDMQAEAKRVANEALLTALALKDEDNKKAKALMEVTSTLIDIDMLEKAVEVANIIQVEEYKEDTLATLAGALAKNVSRQGEALKMAQSIGNEEFKARALVSIIDEFAQNKNQEGIRNIMEITKTIKGEEYIAQVLKSIIFKFNQEGDREGLKLARVFAESLRDEWFKCQLLTDISIGLRNIDLSLAKEIYLKALQFARLAGREACFMTIGNSVPLITEIFRGKILWQAYQEIIYVERWWVKPESSKRRA